MATNFGSMTGSEFLRLMRGNTNPVPNMQIKPQQSSGLPSLLELYNDPEYGDLLEQIYPDTSEQSRKQALGALLLGGIAPAALQFAQGVPLEEAIEPLPAAFAEAGLRAQQGKQATEQARREARFKLASDELTRQRATQAEANKLQAFTPGSSVYRGGELAFTVPEKQPKLKVFTAGGFETEVSAKELEANPGKYFSENPLGDVTIYPKVDLKLPNGTIAKASVPMTVTNKVANKLPIGSYSTTKPDFVTVIRDNRQIQIPRDQILPTDTFDTAGRIEYFEEDPNSGTGYIRKSMSLANYNQNGLPRGAFKDRPEGSTNFQKYYDKDFQKLVNISVFKANQDPDRYSIPDNTEIIDVYDKKGNKVKISFSEYEKNPDKYDVEFYTPMSLMNDNYEIKTAFSKAEEAKIRKEGFALPPKIKPEQSYSGVTLSKIDDNEDYKTATSLEEELEIRKQGYVVKTEAVKEKTIDYTERGARSILPQLSNQILADDFDINSDEGKKITQQFEGYLGALTSKTGSSSILINTDEGVLTPTPPQVPSYVIQALQKIINLQQAQTSSQDSDATEPNAENQFLINTFGLIQDQKVIQEPEYISLISDPNNFGNAFNFSVFGATKAAVDGLLTNLSILTTGRVSEAFPERSEASTQLRGLNHAAENAWLQSLGAKSNQQQQILYRQAQPSIEDAFVNPITQGRKAKAFATRLFNDAQELQGRIAVLEAMSARTVKQAADLSNFKASKRYFLQLSEDYDLIGDKMLSLSSDADLKGKNTEDVFTGGVEF